jgi:small-conductance mechanosensitive channel/CRP-like cAMP-binding protein
VDLFAALAPHGSREEGLLAAIALLGAILLLLFIRFAAPRKNELRLTSALVLLALFVVSFALRVVIDWPPAQSALGTTAIVFIALALARLTFLLVFDVVIAWRRKELTPRIVRDLSQGVIVLFACGLALRSAGVEAGHLLTTSALLSVVAGLALQETLGNLLAGLTLQADSPFQVGDWIEVHAQPGQNGHIGKVREINWRATRIHTLDNVDVILPNGPLGKANITNFDRPHRAARRSVYFHAPYSTPPRDVHEVVLSSIREAPGVLATPAPSIVTFGFDDAGMQYWLRFFIDDMGRRDAIDGAVRDRVWYALARASISISVPGRRVEMHEISESSEARRKSRAIEERLEAISKIELLASISPDDLASLADRAKSALFAPGEVVIRQGDTGDTMFVVLRGELVVRVGPSGKETEAARLTAGAFFGEMSLLTGDKRTATVAAVTSCELLVIDHEAFRAILSAHPAIAETISAKVVERQTGLMANRAPADGEKVADPMQQSNMLLGRIRRFFRL